MIIVRCLLLSWHDDEEISRCSAPVTTMFSWQIFVNRHWALLCTLHEFLSTLLNNNEFTKTQIVLIFPQVEIKKYVVEGSQMLRYVI